MLKRIAGIIVALLALAAPALAQTPFVRVSPTVTLAVTTTSGRVAIGTSARISTLWVCNTGSNDAYIYFGDSTVVALTDGTILRSGVCGNISPDGKTNLAAITAASTTTLVITPGSGVLFGTGGGGGSGGGGGAVTVADGANVVEGTTTDAASCASGTSLIACERQLHADLLLPGTVAGGAANGVATSGNPLQAGCVAQSAEAPVLAGQAASVVCDLARKVIVLPYANPENLVSGVTAAMTGTTSTSLLAAPAAGLRNYATQLICTNSHATVGTFVLVQDGSGGTTIYEGYAAAVGGGFSITFPAALRQPTTATALFVQDVTTGANVICSGSGYKGA